MKPFNKHYLVKLIKSEKEELIFVPETSKKRLDKYVEVQVLEKSEDCKFSISINDKLIVFGNMVEKLDLYGQDFYLLPESAILLKL